MSREKLFNKTYVFEGAFLSSTINTLAVVKLHFAIMHVTVPSVFLIFIHLVHAS